MKNKKFLIPILALHLMSGINAYSDEKDEQNKINNNIGKETQKKKKKNRNYRAIEILLKKKNRELKDLYLQNDFIVKPEYSAWQIFSTTFYKGSKNKTNNDISKPLQVIDDHKKVDLGTILNINELEKNISDINVAPVEIPVVTITDYNFTPPDSLVIPSLDIASIDIKAPNINIIKDIPTPFILRKGNLNLEGSSTGFFPDGRYTGIISQMDLTSGSVSAVMEDVSSGFAGSYELKNVVGTASKGKIFDDRYDPITGLTGLAVLPSDGNYIGSSDSLIGIIGIQNAAIMRVGVSNASEPTFTVSLESGLSTSISTTISVYRMFFNENRDEESNLISYPTLDKLEANNWITSTEKADYSKYLDASLNENTSNRSFQILESNADIYLSGKEVNVLTMSGYVPENVTQTFRNKGRIIGLNEASLNGAPAEGHSVFQFLWGAIGKENGERTFLVDNLGTVELRAPQSVFVTTDDMSSSYQKNDDSQNGSDGGSSKYVTLNNGIVKMYGNKNIGIYTEYEYSMGVNRMIEQIYETYMANGTWNKSHYMMSIQNNRFILNEPLIMLGDQSIGLDLKSVIDNENSKFKFDIGTEDPRQNIASTTGMNGLENSGNLVTKDNRYTDNSMGMYINLSNNLLQYEKQVTDMINPANNENTQYTTVYSPEMIFSDYLINIGAYSRNSIAVVVDNTGDVVLGMSNDTTTNHEINLLSGSENNIGIFVTGANAQLKTNGTLINIDGENQLGVNVEDDGKFYHNNGKITLNGLGNTGIAVFQTGLGEMNNTGSLDVYAGNYGIYNNGTFNMTNAALKVDGNKALGIYTEIGNTLTTITGGSITVDNGAIGLYSNSNSIINLNATDIKTGKDGLTFYGYNNGITYGKYNLTGTTTVEVKAEGIAFYIDGGSTIGDYLYNTFVGMGNLDVTLRDNSILYLIEGLGSSYNLTDLESMTGVITLIPQITFNPVSGNFIPVAMNKGTLVIDNDVNINDVSSLYVKSSFTNLSVNVNPNKTISGSQSNQVGIAQRNYNGSTGINAVQAVNNGTIDLQGANSVGVATDYGHIINNSVIKITGNNSVGVFGSNGTLINNNGEIIINGVDTVGIYGANHLDKVTPAVDLGYGTDEINISNNGKITSQGVDKMYGIYVDNVAVPKSNSQINLQGGSNIDLSTSNQGVGIYTNNTTVTGGGIITVGLNGLGIYAKNSDINLTGMTLNLHGDNALGFYLDGTTNFVGTGNIDVKGKNISLFNVKSSGIFSQNYNITSTADSSYTIGSVNDTTFIYNGTANLAMNGSLVSGTNSAILLDTNAVVNATGDATAGVVVTGQYTGVLPVGFRSGIDVENKGNISLNNGSVGLYGLDNVRMSNVRNISVGDNSLGISTKGSGSLIENNGNISIGASSAALYGVNSNILENKSTGYISSVGNESIGIYAEENVPIINNNGVMELLGSKSIGIYVRTNNGTTVNNTGRITVGDSLGSSNPGIGIFSESSLDVINNSGIIQAGTESVGIYTKQGTINNNREISVGNGGEGVYLDGGIINLSATSQLKAQDEEAIGVYAINNGTIVNNGTTIIRNNSYGYALKTGSIITNNGTGVVGNDSIFIYGDGSGAIDNSGDLMMIGSKGVGIYSLNSGAVNNTGNIVGVTGVTNTGLYVKNGKVTNTGNITLGDSKIIDERDVSKNYYSIGIHGDNSEISNSGNIKVGYYGIGMYAKDPTVPVVNTGDMISNSEGAIGLFIENGKLINNGDIHLTGNQSKGIYANNDSEVINTGTITMDGENSTGIYLNRVSKVDNQGIININGNNSQGIILKVGSSLINGTGGVINIAAGTIGSESISSGEGSYPVPSLINAGIINVSENFEVRGIDVTIKVDPNTITNPSLPEDMGASFVSDAVKFYAPAFNTTEVIGVLPDFTQGTQAEVYKLKDVFNPTTLDKGGPDSGIINTKSKSLTWKATPVVNSKGNVDIWMEKIPYDTFTGELWYEDFGKALDKKYAGAVGDAGKIYDKIDMIETEIDFRRTMSSLAGDIYANMNQREVTISDIFEDSLRVIQNSKNNTKEGIKLNVIAGKGSANIEADEVLGYDYTSAGIIALKEVERTYKHTFGYSLGYLYTGFEFDNDKDNKEKVNTFQVGAHSRYKSKSLIVRNDITGRISLHDIERVVDWTNSGKSKSTGKYESYSITSDNMLGREIELGDNASITPYGAVKVMYTARPTFSEKELERLEVKGNDAWSVKPRVGVELVAGVPISTNGWELKGSLDIAYEYELADINKKEQTKLMAIEDNYHSLSKPEKEKGKIKTKASVGIEVKDKYGVYLTGEYNREDKDQDEYRAGITFKASFN